MANIAEQLIGQAMETAGTTPDMTAGINQGAQLAQNIEQMQMKRQQLEMQKQELEMKKDEELASSFETIGKIKSPTMRKIYVEKVLNNKLKMLGREDMFDPAVFEAVQKGDQESINRVLNGIAKVRRGEMSGDEFRATLKNADDFITLESYDSEFQKAQEAAQDFKERKFIAQQQGGRLAGQFAVNKVIDFKKSFDQITTPLRTRYIAGNTALSLLDSKNPIADEAAKGQVSRLSGEVGVLTDQDVARFGGSKAVLERMQQAITQVQEGKLTPQNREFLRTVALRIRESVGTEIKNQAERSIESAAALGFDTDQVRAVIGVDKVLAGGRSNLASLVDTNKDRYAKLPQEQKDKYIAGVAKKLGIKEDEVRKAFGGK